MISRFNKFKDNNEVEDHNNSLGKMALFPAPEELSMSRNSTSSSSGLLGSNMKPGPSSVSTVVVILGNILE